VTVSDTNGRGSVARGDGVWHQLPQWFV